MSRITEYKGLVAIHPGYYLEALLNYYAMSQDEVALRIGTTAKTVSLLVNGLGPVSAQMADSLGQVFSMDPAQWLKYDSDYNQTMVRISRLKSLDQQSAIASGIDFQYFVDNKIVRSFTDDAESKTLQLQKLFMISDLNSLTDMEPYTQSTKRKEAVSDKEALSCAVWFQTALRIGREVQCEEFNVEKLRSVVPQLKPLMFQKKEEAVCGIRHLLAAAGVAFVVFPAMKDNLIKGFVKWLHGSRKCVFAMCDDFEYEDDFWLTVFTGIGHVFQRRLTRLILNDGGRLIEPDEYTGKLDEQARHYAYKQLMGVRDYTLFSARKNYTAEIVREYAERCHILPSMIASRLISEGRVQPVSAFTSMRKKNKAIRSYLWDDLDNRDVNPLLGNLEIPLSE